MFELEKIGKGDDDGITETTVVCSVFHLFGEDVAAVNDAGNVIDVDIAISLGFSNFVFAEVDVLRAFVGKG